MAGNDCPRLCRRKIMLLAPVCTALALAQPHFSFPHDAVTNEEIVLRWVHFIAGITWIGLLYFFNLVSGRSLSELKGPTRMEVFPVLMSRAMWWFRWSAV